MTPLVNFTKLDPVKKSHLKFCPQAQKWKKHTKKYFDKKNCWDGHFKEPFYQKTFLKTYFLFPSGVFAAMALF